MRPIEIPEGSPEHAQASCGDFESFFSRACFLFVCVFFVLDRAYLFGVPLPFKGHLCSSRVLIKAQKQKNWAKSSVVEPGPFGCRRGYR